MLSQYGINLYGNTKFTKFLFYLLGIVVGSVATEIFVSPISIYHFNNYSPYNMVANLIAMPLTSFLIMPAGIISFPLMLIGLEKIALIPMAFGINIILEVSKEIVSWDDSVFMIPQLPPFSMFLFFIGLIWISLWRRFWRFFGLLPILIGTVLIFMSKNPDVIVDGDGKFFAIFDKCEKQLYFSKEPYSDFKKTIIMNENGQTEFKLIHELDNQNMNNETKNKTNFNFKCYENFCLYEKLNKKIYFITKNYNLNKIDFNPKSIVVDVTYKGWNKKYITCEKCTIFDKKDLEKNGTRLFYIKNSEIKILNTYN
jgi:hypothetical protein